MNEPMPKILYGLEASAQTKWSLDSLQAFVKHNTPQHNNNTKQRNSDEMILKFSAIQIS